jgi:hypothetical protein
VRHLHLAGLVANEVPTRDLAADLSARVDCAGNVLEPVHGDRFAQDVVSKML